MKHGDKVRIKGEGPLQCWAESGEVYIPRFYHGHVTYINESNRNLMVYVKWFDAHVQTNIDDWEIME